MIRISTNSIHPNDPNIDYSLSLFAPPKPTRLAALWPVKQWEPSSYEEKIIKAIEEQELSQAEKFSHLAVLSAKISAV